ncbi:TraB/GumN family protein [Shewanella salipaludis]|uniref:TraB/GumN family protein n=1 Tax=Shewanella salipaludis TaxID=2723052 RepID=A0A972FW43_9GAMM|nr:TraB/GumN family protein [Shewanella salipaludis]NMH66851.1 TraB/GumN family protein [Shewanella salipaludis]
MATSRWRQIMAMNLLWLLCLSQAAVAAVSDTPPFFRIHYQGKTAYLLGSIHVGREDFYPLAPQIEAKFAGAAGLVVEVDVTKADGAALIQKYGAATGEMDEETRVLMQSYCANRGRLCQSLQAYAPWLQSLQLSLYRYASMGYSADKGIDTYLLARNAPRQVFELETIGFQLGLLASLSQEAQWSMVRDAVSASDAEVLALIDAWRSGDEAQIARLMEQQLLDKGEAELVEALLWRRNLGMADKIRRLMSAQSSPEPLFIVVGAGHLVGQKSLVKQLTAAGAELTSCWSGNCD